MAQAAVSASQKTHLAITRLGIPAIEYYDPGTDDEVYFEVQYIRIPLWIKHEQTVNTQQERTANKEKTMLQQ